MNEENQRNQIIWNNKNICIGNKPIFYDKELGILTGKDFMLDKGIDDFFNSFKSNKMSFLEKLKFSAVRLKLKKCESSTQEIHKIYIMNKFRVFRV